FRKYPCSGSPVTLVLQRLDLREIHAVENEPCRVKTTEALLHPLINQAVVGLGRLPAHSADQACCFHGHLRWYGLWLPSVRLDPEPLRALWSPRLHPPPRHQPMCPPRPDADGRVRRVAWPSPGTRHRVNLPAPRLSSTAPGWRSGSPSPGPRRPHRP